MRRVLLLATLALPIAATAVVLAPAHSGADGIAFEQVVGGIGLGPATDPARCRPMFDPRIDAACSWRYAPLPGGDFFCPCHR